MTLRDIHFEAVEDQLQAIFYDLLFHPLASILKKSTPTKAEFMNTAEDVLREALRSGRIQYAAGVFSGDFNAAISRSLRALGGALDKRTGVYRVPNVPAWVVVEAGARLSAAKETHRAMTAALDEAQRTLEAKLEPKRIDASVAIGEFEGDWKETAKVLEVNPELTPNSRQRMLDDYSNNMKLWIKKFVPEQIQDLRRVVEKNATEGYRFDRLIDGIENRYSVSQSKAAFLARQETALFMSKFRRERFGDAGVTHYRWSTSKDERVRRSHRHLNGRVFAYARPPVVDDASGRHANPGEDFNCRCVDIPILDPAEALVTG